ncbi:hypothetical protein [Phyllobacterium bourgognense]|uniref:EF-hand domain-containing protein n=1 Tax=Phyllobacterium bourgognense TaxID=314236 RepID=A0A368Z3L4_9HYPH|nr:hypothetical protein [Phyllobacterium bourgognense]RCW86368.1 hypothetical protein C7476_102348 [Phyllobacterium bourgognense]
MKKMFQAAVILAFFNTSVAVAMPLSGMGEMHADAVVQVKDGRFGSPPIDPNLPPVTGDSINAEVNAEVAARFAEAAGTSSGLLTVSQAKNASWGYVADHFTAIDRDGDGYVKLGDVLDFMQGRSGSGVQSGQIPAGPKSIQIVE